MPLLQCTCYNRISHTQTKRICMTLVERCTYSTKRNIIYISNLITTLLEEVVCSSSAKNTDIKNIFTLESWVMKQQQPWHQNQQCVSGKVPPPQVCWGSNDGCISTRLVGKAVVNIINKKIST